MDFPWGAELHVLWRFATRLEAARGKADAGPDRQDYNFYVENDRVRIVERKRGSPIDKLVAEMMILVNSEWGRQLAQADVPGIYRVQGGGKVRMSTVAGAPRGPGRGAVHLVELAAAPLRRPGQPAPDRRAGPAARRRPTAKGERRLLIAMRDFELAYDAYAEFQRSMERYWCLRWLLQEQAQRTRAVVIRESLVRIDRIPLVVRMPSLPELPAGTPVEVEFAAIDLLTPASAIAGSWARSTEVAAVPESRVTRAARPHIQSSRAFDSSAEPVSAKPVSVGVAELSTISRRRPPATRSCRSRSRSRWWSTRRCCC